MSEFSWHKLRHLASGPRRIGLVALVCLIVTGVFMLWTSRSLLRATLSAPAPSAAATPAPEAGAMAAQLQAHAERINGRSLFFIPSPPRREVVEGPRNSGPPPPPSRYGGPPLIAMVNDTAWFGDGTRLRMGEEPKAGASVKLVSLQPPWSAKVLWSGAEFTVSLFERSTVLAPPKPAEAPPVDGQAGASAASSPAAPGAPPSDSPAAPAPATADVPAAPPPPPPNADEPASPPGPPAPAVPKSPADANPQADRASTPES